MTSPYLTRAEAAAYVRCRSLDSFDHWVKSRGVRPSGRRGRIPLYRRDMLDRVLAVDAVSRKLRRAS